MNKEIWKDIPDYEGLYEISNYGRVKSLPKKIRNNAISKEKILKIQLNENNRCYVFLFKNNSYKKFLIHRLVAQAFISNPNEYPIINHKDENPLNNKADNLEWCTYSYNNTYGTRIEKVLRKIYVPILKYDKNLKFIKKYKSIKNACTELNIKNGAHIVDVLKGRRKTAYGFIWKYADGEKQAKKV